MGDADFNLPAFNFDPDPSAASPKPAPEPISDMEQQLRAQQEAEVLKALEEVVEAEAEVIEIEQKEDAFIQEQLALQAQVNELQAKIDALKRKKRSIDNELFSIRNEKVRRKKIVDTKNSAVEVTRQKYERKIKAEASKRYLAAKAEKFAWWQGVDGHKILPHQWEAVVFLSTARRAILGDKMGLGKTLSSIATLDMIEAKRVLIITPADVASNFEAELKRWAPHRPSVSLKGMTKSQRNQALKFANMMPEFTVVVNYEIWRRDSKLIEKLIDLQFDTVILDEAHSIKSLKSDAYKVVNRIVFAHNSCPQCGKLIGEEMRARYNQHCECGWDRNRDGDPVDEEGIELAYSVRNVIPMTGTPILNSPEDLFSMLHLIDPVNFSSKNYFLRSYAEMGFDGRWKFRPGGESALLKVLGAKFIARSAKDAGIILPEQKPIYHDLDLFGEYSDIYPKQLEVIKQLSKFASITLGDKTLPIFSIIALITRQRQANVWPGGIRIKDKDPITGAEQIVFDVSEEIQESIKIDKALEMIQEFVSNGERVAIFSQFATGLEALKSNLDTLGIRSVRFDGSTPENIKEQVKSNFDKKRGETPKWDVVLANYKTGGVGLNLTACTQMIMIDMEWNPGREDQAMARINRIGQDKETFVHILQIPKTVDTWMRQLISDKKAMIEGFNENQQEFQAAYLDALNSGEA